ncbi:enoyl-CoA hydratase [Dethiosulfatarculus sandiegensis]|uniref:Enoyl-CoA hydratase domain-containing protein 3, mitochondrial n=1 Tax=Dethiosulfatarculus sandiegensis TaxID=1429043 RepID=A0A0D2G941_9BACT|nr:enoyl-CoA hydratase [Dethiosulfatarculus sandiegensis]KIX11397.1 enoyl-CoA hydratase [Dethiosulfatarculus sandiegensis]
MHFEEIEYYLEGPLAFITLNRPEKVNSLSEKMIAELSLALDRIASEQQAKVVVLNAAGNHFCAGHLLDEMIDKDPVDYQRIFANCTKMMEKLRKLPQPVVGLVQGVATAAGCQLAAACDLVVASKTARFGTPGVKIGLFCSTPAVPLVRAIGPKRALEMLLTGRMVSAGEAQNWGLVNKVAEPSELVQEGKNLALSVAKASPLTLAMGKSAFYSQVDRPENQAYDLAQRAIALNLTMEDAQEGIKAFLNKKEPPEWKGR